MTMEAPRELIRKALTEYAGFFRGVAAGEQEQVLLSLRRMREIDTLASEQLNEDALGFYRIRRTRLMQLFRRRLFSEIQDQLETDVLHQVEDLLEKLEADTSEVDLSH